MYIKDPQAPSSSMDTSSDPYHLELTQSLEYDQVKYSTQHNMFCMASVKAPFFETEDRKQRAPIDLVCVIDKSGSMDGMKIELVKKTLSFVIDQLKQSDRLAIVEFDSDVTTSVKLTEMDQQGKLTAQHSVKQIKAGSCTNISGALFEAFEIIKQRNNPATVSSILLFTDGLPTKGIMDQKKLTLMVEKFMNNNYLGPHPCTLFTFGFGVEHSANMLVSMSQVGGGLYYYVQKEDEIPQSFSDCLGGLIAVVAQNIVLKIKCSGDNGVVLKQVMTGEGGYKQQIIEPNREIHVRLGDLYAEENRDIVFELELPVLRSALEKQELVTVSLSYANVVSTEMDQLHCTSFISRSESTLNSSGQPNLLIDRQRNRLLTVEALRQAKLYADSNALDSAKEVLNGAMLRIQQSPSEREDFCQGLVRDLRQCLNEMTTVDRYANVGSKMVNAYWCANVQQRSSHNTATTYETKSKKCAKAKIVSFASK